MRRKGEPGTALYRQFLAVLGSELAHCHSQACRARAYHIAYGWKTRHGWRRARASGAPQRRGRRGRVRYRA